MTNNVTEVKAASPADALKHFEDSFSFETDCWDVHDALSKGADNFILLDVRGPEMFAKGHVPGAINLPVGKIITSKLKQWPDDMLIVTYCAGPHCNGAAKGAARLAKLARPCKIMAGGITGWIDEGFDLETSD
ncbi:MAG: rhodanese-like domain-containing protein [Hyphomicrobiales bacterium]